MISFLLILIIVYDIIKMILFADEMEFTEIIFHCILIALIIWGITIGWILL